MSSHTANFPGDFITSKIVEDEDEIYVENDLVYIKRVIYNKPVTVVFWSDDTKTVCKCSEEDTYSKETGLAICILKKLTSASKIKDVFDTWITKGNEPNSQITLHDVRKKFNSKNK